MRQATAFLLLSTANNADLVTKLAAFFGKWVDMQPGGLRLQGY